MQRCILAIVCVCFVVVTVGAGVSQAQVDKQGFAIDDAWINPERRPIVEPIGMQFSKPPPLIEQEPQTIELTWYVKVVIAVIVVVIMKQIVDDL